MGKGKKAKEPPIHVNSNVWKSLLEIEDLRVRERKLIRKLWYDLREDSTRRIHKMVFEQALQSDSAFPSMDESELEKWIIENISAVFIALIEQGDITSAQENGYYADNWIEGIKQLDQMGYLDLEI